MNNTEKKLDALIDALGFDVEVAMTKKGRPYGSLAGSPAYAAVHRFVDGLWYEYDIDYKLTKRKSPPVKYHHCRKCGTHIANGNPLDSCLCKSSKFLIECTGVYNEEI
jgi:hypothetical protein